MPLSSFAKKDNLKHKKFKELRTNCLGVTGFEGGRETFQSWNAVYEGGVSLRLLFVSVT